ncbi:MAG: acyl-CoA dehydratase activase [Candidatus Brocadiia bacterium]
METQGTAIGVDLGSRMTKIVRLEDGRIAEARAFDTAPEPMAPVRKVLQQMAPAPTVATGYGRHLARADLDCEVVTEILACARAARHLHPETGSAIDIGGQDTKVIELSEAGFGRFEMNDRCAAGTGRFLEVMARALDYSLEEFARAAQGADRALHINSMCTVFAESEVVSLIARGEDRARIARGLHAAIARRVATMASAINLGDCALFVGGVARNPCMAHALQEELPCRITVPDSPELAVALGAALLALD